MMRSSAICRIRHDWTPSSRECFFDGRLAASACCVHHSCQDHNFFLGLIALIVTVLDVRHL